MVAAQKALWYIESHFGAGLALGDVAAAAGVSPFHLTRVFQAATGWPVVRYLRARRLSEAARELAAGAPDILDVALSAGYGSHEAFTRAFREQFGATPEEIRQRRSLEGLRVVEAMRVMQEPTPEAQVPRVANFSGLPAEYTRLRLARRSYAVVRHTGHIGSIPLTWRAFLENWLPASGLMAADAPDFERYDAAFDPLTGMGGVEIWVPLAP